MKKVDIQEIFLFYGGKAVEVDPENSSEEEVGLMMAGMKGGRS